MKTILIADDNAMMRRLFQHTFAHGHRVVTAENGAQALELAERERPDLIVLDILMPDMDGHEVLKRLKADPCVSDIPVVFLTGMTEAGDELRGLELGAIDYWIKPFQPAIVRARARNYLELKSGRDALTQLAFQDGLTGIANRRAFDEILDHEWRRARRSDEPVCVILADVDHFKAYNDTQGHGAGDACLSRVATIFQNQMQRAGDFTARYGGEEFVCLLANTDLNSGAAVAEKIRAAIEQAALPHGASDVCEVVTMSFGVAACIPEELPTPQDLTEAADTALYRAKHAGRNQVATMGEECVQRAQCLPYPHRSGREETARRAENLSSDPGPDRQRRHHGGQAQDHRLLHLSAGPRHGLQCRKP